MAGWATAGAVMGATLAVVMPVSVAAIRNHDPIHRGSYFEAGELLIVALPLAFGLGLSVLGIKNDQLARTVMYSSLGLIGLGIATILVALWAYT